jgi:hypothetical protein
LACGTCWRNNDTRIEINSSALKETRWYQLAIRLCIRGLVTAATGLIAKSYGPAIGGLFLAFPAIFPSTATLIEKHEKQAKEEAGIEGTKPARKAVSLDASGAAMGSLGLLVFAWVVTECIERYTPWLVMLAATVGWMGCQFLSGSFAPEPSRVCVVAWFRLRKWSHPSA